MQEGRQDSTTTGNKHDYDLDINNIIGTGQQFASFLYSRPAGFASDAPDKMQYLKNKLSVENSSTGSAFEDDCRLPGKYPFKVGSCEFNDSRYTSDVSNIATNEVPSNIPSSPMHTGFSVPIDPARKDNAATDLVNDVKGNPYPGSCDQNFVINIANRRQLQRIPEEAHLKPLNNETSRQRLLRLSILGMKKGKLADHKLRTRLQIKAIEVEFDYSSIRDFLTPSEFFALTTVRSSDLPVGAPLKPTQEQVNTYSNANSVVGNEQCVTSYGESFRSVCNLPNNYKSNFISDTNTTNISKTRENFLSNTSPKSESFLDTTEEDEDNDTEMDAAVKYKVDTSDLPSSSEGCSSPQRYSSFGDKKIQSLQNIPTAQFKNDHSTTVCSKPVRSSRSKYKRNKAPRVTVDDDSALYVDSVIWKIPTCTYQGLNHVIRVSRRKHDQSGYNTKSASIRKRGLRECVRVVTQHMQLWIQSAMLFPNQKIKDFTLTEVPLLFFNIVTYQLFGTRKVAHSPDCIEDISVNVGTSYYKQILQSHFDEFSRMVAAPIVDRDGTERPFPVPETFEDVS